MLAQSFLLVSGEWAFDKTCFRLKYFPTKEDAEAAFPKNESCVAEEVEVTVERPAPNGEEFLVLLGTSYLDENGVFDARCPSEAKGFSHQTDAIDAAVVAGCPLQFLTLGARLAKPLKAKEEEAKQDEEIKNPESEKP